MAIIYNYHHTWVARSAGWSGWWCRCGGWRRRSDTDFTTSSLKAFNMELAAVSRTGVQLQHKCYISPPPTRARSKNFSGPRSFLFIIRAGLLIQHHRRVVSLFSVKNARWRRTGNRNDTLDCRHRSGRPGTNFPVVFVRLETPRAAAPPLRNDNIIIYRETTDGHTVCRLYAAAPTDSIRFRQVICCHAWN